jgi:hypothetical protein
VEPDLGHEAEAAAGERVTHLVREHAHEDHAQPRAERRQALAPRSGEQEGGDGEGDLDAHRDAEDPEDEEGARE